MCALAHETRQAEPGELLRVVSQSSGPIPAPPLREKLSSGLEKERLAPPRSKASVIPAESPVIHPGDLRRGLLLFCRDFVSDFQLPPRLYVARLSYPGAPPPRVSETLTFHHGPFYRGTLTRAPAFTLRLVFIWASAAFSGLKVSRAPTAPVRPALGTVSGLFPEGKNSARVSRTELMSGAVKPSRLPPDRASVCMY